MASSCSSSNVTHTPIFDELFAVSDAVCKGIVRKRVRKAIREMESKSDKEAWTDSLDCFKDNKTRLEVKLSRLTQLTRGVSDKELRGEDYSKVDVTQGATFAVIKIRYFKD
ncbi:hypothetical protein Tco_0805034 [Tanacetum coccineum]